MSKKANPTVIGSFVVGAVVLVVVGILIFGSGQYFGEKLTYVLYFEDSLKGLNPGAPVMFRGTRVGSVSDIKVVIDAQSESIRVPVYIQLDEKEVDVVNAEPASNGPGEGDETQDRAFINRLIAERGLRAQLEMQSLVTGQLLVQLDFFPDAPPVDPPKMIRGQIPEFPTIQSSLKQFAQKLENLPLKEVASAALQAIKSLDQLLSSPDVKGFVSEGKGMIIDFRGLIKNLDQTLPPLVATLEEAIGEAKGLVQNVDSHIEPMASSFEEVAGEARTSLIQARRTLSTMEQVLGKDSPVRFRLSTALKELAAAARSVRDLADYIERHPEALVRGKN